MIKIVDGDILKAEEDVICHQVNCFGVMNSGLAKQIRNKYPEAYKAYINYCKDSDQKRLLGNICTVMCNDNKVIVHLFGQYDYGRNKQYTNYEALKESLQSILHVAKMFNDTIAIPYNLGCGLAGGDWKIVYKIIEDVFQNYDVTLYRWEV